MLACVVTYRRHFTLSDLRDGHRQAAPFPLLLPTPLFPLPHLSPLLPVVSALSCATENINPLLFNGFRTLCQKPPGVGGTPASPYEEKMKPRTVTPVVLSARCTHRTASGRRCRLSVSDAHSSLCRQHRAELLQEQSAGARPEEEAVMTSRSSGICRSRNASGRRAGSGRPQDIKFFRRK